MTAPLEPEDLAYEVAMEVITHFEGLRLTAYLCPAGQPTVGYGHLIQYSDQIAVGQKIEHWEADEFLRDDMVKAARTVELLVTPQLHPFQKAALVSFVFNLGEGNFITSTLLKKTNSGDMRGAAAEFKRWIFAGGKPLEGLQRRREAEAGLFLAGHCMTTKWEDA